MLFQAEKDDFVSVNALRKFAEKINHRGITSCEYVYLPGTIYKVIARLSRELPVPLIAGGLLADKADVTAALSAGALCVSASDPELWDL